MVGVKNSRDKPHSCLMIAFILYTFSAFQRDPCLNNRGAASDNGTSSSPQVSSKEPV